MNIEVIKPEVRLELPIESNVTTLLVINRGDDRKSLLVGYVNGDISVYKMPQESSGLRNNVKLLKSYKSLSDIKTLFRKGNGELDFSINNVTVSSLAVGKIIKLSLAPNDSTILAIGDSGAVRIHELVDRRLKMLQELQKSKDFVDFIYLKSKNLFVVANNKKNLLFYSTPPSGPIKFQLINEVTLKDKIKKLGKFSDREVIIGLENDFVVMDVEKDFEIGQLPQAEPKSRSDKSSQFDNDFVVMGNEKYFEAGQLPQVRPKSLENLFSQTSSSSFSYFRFNNNGGPQVQIVPFNNSDFILSQDSNIVKYSSTDSMSTPVPVASVTSLSILYLKPCFLVLVFPKKLEIIDYDNGEVVQLFSHQFNSNAVSTAHDDDFIYIGSGKTVFKFKILTSTDLVSQYLRKGNENHEDQGYNHKILKKGDTTDFKLEGIEKAISLVARLNDNDKYFGLQSNNGVSKQLKLRKLYEEKVKILFEKYHNYKDALEVFASYWLISFDIIMSLFPDYLNGQVQLSESQSEADNTSLPTVPNSEVNRIKDVSLESLQQYEPNLDSSGTDPDTGRAAISQLPNTQSRPPTIEEFILAVSKLIVYLTFQRRIIRSFRSEGKLKWHNVEISHEEIYGDISIERLSAIIDTTLFLCYFHTKPMLLGSLLRLPDNHCDSSIVNKCLLQNLHVHSFEGSAAKEGNRRPSDHIKELLDFYYGRSLHKEALEMLKKLAHDESSMEHDNEFDFFLRKPDLTIQYLQKLDNHKLDLVFEYAQWVIDEQDSIERKIAMSSLIFMNDSYACESYDSLAVIENFSKFQSGSTLIIRYLEWLLFESDVIDKYKGEKEPILKLYTRLCLECLSKLKEVARATPEVSDLLSDSQYILLYKVLDTSLFYEPWTVLTDIPSGDSRFLRLTVLIYKRLQEHDKAIDILFNQLDDLDSAMSYCSAIYKQSDSIGQKLLHKLLEDLIIASATGTDAIEKLLIQEGSKMSILTVLEKLPDSFPMINLAPFLTRTLRSSKELLHDSRIAAQLYKVSLVKLQLNLLESQRQFYSISSGNEKCSVCNKKLGYSVFTVTKSGDVIHYGCLSK